MQPAIKYAGGKSRLAHTIHNLAPPSIIVNKAAGYVHRVYVYGGGLGEMWNWNYEGISELANDIDLQVSNFWSVLQREDTFQQFRRIISATPFSRVEFTKHRLLPADFTPNVEAAVAFFIQVRQSRSGGLKHFAPITRARTRRRMNEQASAWWSAIKGLPAVYDRLQRVAIECMDALSVIKQEDTPRTLFYCDPPYFPSTKSTDAYAFEMTVEQHHDLLNLLRCVKGKVMLSGYRNQLYDELLADWNRHDVNVANNMAGGAQKRRRIESLWLNY